MAAPQWDRSGPPRARGTEGGRERTFRWCFSALAHLNELWAGHAAYEYYAGVKKMH